MKIYKIDPEEYFQNIYPNNSYEGGFIEVFKGSETELKDYMENIKGNLEITRFHGRSTMETKIKKVYEYE